MKMLDLAMLDGSLEILFYIACLLGLGLCAVLVARGAMLWRRDSRAPRLTVPAGVVSLRVGRRLKRASDHYATFRVESGDCIELCVPGRDFAYLSEGDSGRLTFQGRRYVSFERGAAPL